MTSGNLGPLMFGQKKIPVDQRPPSFFHSFSEQGYVTGFVNSKCEGLQCEGMRVEDGATTSHYSFDHESIAMFCDKNYDSDEDDQFDNVKGHYSIFRRCLYGLEAHNHELEYMR